MGVAAALAVKNGAEKKKKKTHKILPDWKSVVKETELGQLCKSAGQRAGTSTAVIVIVVKGSAHGALRDR